MISYSQVHAVQAQNAEQLAVGVRHTVSSQGPAVVGCSSGHIASAAPVPSPSTSPCATNAVLAHLLLACCCGNSPHLASPLASAIHFTRNLSRAVHMSPRDWLPCMFPLAVHAVTSKVLLASARELCHCLSCMFSHAVHAQELGHVIWAHAALNHHPGSHFLTLVCGSLGAAWQQQQGSSLLPQELPKLLWALAVLTHNPGPELLGLATAQAQRYFLHSLSHVVSLHPAISRVRRGFSLTHPGPIQAAAAMQQAIWCMCFACRNKVLSQHMLATISS